MASKKLITFDPTIHAGHVLTAITIIVSAAAIWFGTLNTVANHETALKQHTQRMDNIEAHASAEREPRAARQVSLHRIRSGDTLSEIADKYGVRVSTLKKLNPKLHGRIQPGQKLRVK